MLLFSSFQGECSCDQSSVIEEVSQVIRAFKLQKRPESKEVIEKDSCNAALEKIQTGLCFDEISWGLVQMLNSYRWNGQFLYLDSFMGQPSQLINGNKDARSISKSLPNSAQLLVFWQIDSVYYALDKETYKVVPIVSRYESAHDQPQQFIEFLKNIMIPSALKGVS